LVGDTTYSDYGLRLLRSSGTYSQIVHRGTGDLQIQTLEPANIDFYTTSTLRMRITDDGNIGIGSTSIPSNVRAQIIGANRPLATDDTATVLIGNSDTAADDLGGSIGFQHNGADGAMIAAIKAGKQNGTTNGGYLSFATRTDAAFATERMRIDSDGDLGVGATTVNARLHARRTSGTTDPIGLFDAAIGSYTGTVLTSQNTLGPASTYNLFTCVTDSDADAGGPFTEFVVRGDGNIGIGTSSPNYSLTVAGGAADDHSIVQLVNATTGTGAGDGSYISVLGSQSNIRIWNQANADIQIGTNGTERMRITSAGLVGIGTTTPVTTLDVSGTARATQGTPYTTYTANTKTLALTDNGYYTRCSNTTLITITIPNNSSVAFPLGSELIFFQAGSGNVLFANAAGVTLNSKESLVNLSGQYSAATLKKIATNTWDLIGDLA
jgi:hypothetical protein